MFWTTNNGICECNQLGAVLPGHQIDIGSSLRGSRLHCGPYRAIARNDKIIMLRRATPSSGLDMNHPFQRATQRTSFASLAKSSELEAPRIQVQNLEFKFRWRCLLSLARFRSNSIQTDPTSNSNRSVQRASRVGCKPGVAPFPLTFAVLAARRRR